MQKIIDIIQIICAILLITAILMQSRGSGLGSAFGGSGNVYRTKRGLEKGLLIFTIILSIIFFGLGLLNIILPRLN
jgi:preprotein translocase subunit SecG